MNKQSLQLYSRHAFYLSVLLVLLQSTGCSRSEPEVVKASAAKDDGLIVHVTSDADFNQQVLASPLPVLVDFWASWCPPCRMMEPILAEIAIEQTNSLRIVKVNADDARSLAERFNIRALPTLMLFRNGEAVAMQEGAMRKPMLQQWIETQLATADTTKPASAP